MARRKRRAVGPGLVGRDLEAAVAAIARRNPDLVAWEQDGFVMPAVRVEPRRRLGRYGDLDAGQVLRAWSEAKARLSARGAPSTPTSLAVELARDRSTVYRWAERFDLSIRD